MITRSLFFNSKLLPTLILEKLYLHHRETTTCCTVSHETNEVTPLIFTSQWKSAANVSHETFSPQSFQLQPNRFVSKIVQKSLKLCYKSWLK